MATIVKLGELAFDYSSGRIVCDLCQKRWCSHTQEQVTTGEDQKFIWFNEGGAAEYAYNMRLEIPMFPSHDLWTSVGLVFVESARIPMYKVEWMLILDTFFVCNITPGEGRQVIRTCLVEVMYADRSRQEVCSDSSHGPNEQLRWESSRGTQHHVAQDWCIYTTGQCCGCYKKFNAGSIPDDLIPPKEGAWS